MNRTHIKGLVLASAVCMLTILSVSIAAKRWSLPFSPQATTLPAAQKSSPSVQPKITSDNTTLKPDRDLKIYTNNGEFSFKIPAHWTISVSAIDSDQVLEDNDGNYVAEFYKVSEKDKRTTYCESTSHDIEICEILRAPNAVVIVNWGKWISPISREPAVAEVIKGKQIVEFHIEEITEEDQAILRQILSTFKFINW